VQTSIETAFLCNKFCNLSPLSDQVLAVRLPAGRMLSMGEGEWDWPEEKPIASTYYNTAVCGVPPPPKILATETVDEDDVSKRITMVRNYSWSDDTNYIRIYVPVPGVSSEGVAVYIEEDSIKVHAMTPEHGQFTMALNRLYDKVDVSQVCAARALLHSQTRRHGNAAACVSKRASPVACAHSQPTKFKGARRGSSSRWPNSRRPATATIRTSTSSHGTSCIMEPRTISTWCSSSKMRGCSAA